MTIRKSLLVLPLLLGLAAPVQAQTQDIQHHGPDRVVTDAVYQGETQGGAAGLC